MPPEPLGRVTTRAVGLVARPRPAAGRDRVLRRRHCIYHTAGYTGGRRAPTGCAVRGRALSAFDEDR